jgi:hypothetical protein
MSAFGYTTLSFRPNACEVALVSQFAIISMRELLLEKIT